MKTITKESTFEKVSSLQKMKTYKPIKPSMFWRCLIRVISIPGLLGCGFTYKKIGMEKLGKKEPCLILMNHSCFLDLQIAETVMFPRPMNVVCTSDGFVGKNLLMRLIGCIPTNKFVNDIRLVRNMKYAITELKSSILMYPEASYSFDGTATPLPDSLFKCIKLLDVPVVMIRTYGAFSRNPLYNNLQIRKNVKVSADVKYIRGCYSTSTASPPLSLISMTYLLLLAGVAERTMVRSAFAILPCLPITLPMSEGESTTVTSMTRSFSLTTYSTFSLSSANCPTTYLIKSSIPFSFYFAYAASILRRKTAKMQARRERRGFPAGSLLSVNEPGKPQA